MMRLLKMLLTTTALLASFSSAHANFTYDFTAAYVSGTYAGYVTRTPLTGYITLSSNAFGLYGSPFGSSVPDYVLSDYVTAFSVTDGLNTDTSLDYPMSEIDILSSNQNIYQGYLFSSNFSVGSNFSYSSRGPVFFDSATFTLRQATAPVPEPETYAMFLAGLGLLGFAAKRQKRA